MKLAKTIVITTLILWLIQLGLFALLFATWFSSIVVRVLVCFGLTVQESNLQTFISQILKDMMSPIRFILPAHQVGDDSLAVALSLGADSIFWGLILGTLVHLLCRGIKKAKAA